MTVLVDTSVWIDYFRGSGNSELLDLLIDENLLVTNDLILTELIPFLRIKKQRRIISLLNSVSRLPVVISWEEISRYQYRCLTKGFNGIGSLDLIIAQNAMQHGCEVFTLDGHFEALREVIGLRLLER